MLVIRKIEKVLCSVAGVFLFVLAALITFDVVGRFFDAPVRGTQDMSKLLLAFMVWGGVAFVTMTHGHVAIDLFVSRFSPRAQKVIDIVACLFGLFAFAVVLWSNTRTALTTLRLHEVTDILQFPTFPLRFMIPLGASLALVELVFQLVENTMALVRKKEQSI